MESRNLKASGSNPQKGRDGPCLCLSVDANSTQKGGSCHATLELRKRIQKGESHRLWPLWDARAPELQLDLRVHAVVSLLLFFPRLTIQYKTIYKAMLSNLELISSLQEDVRRLCTKAASLHEGLGCCNLVLASFLWL